MKRRILADPYKYLSCGLLLLGGLHAANSHAGEFTIEGDLTVTGSVAAANLGTMAGADAGDYHASSESDDLFAEKSIYNGDSTNAVVASENLHIGDTRIVGIRGMFVLAVWRRSLLMSGSFSVRGRLTAAGCPFTGRPPRSRSM